MADECGGLGSAVIAGIERIEQCDASKHQIAELEDNKTICWSLTFESTRLDAA